MLHTAIAETAFRHADVGCAFLLFRNSCDYYKFYEIYTQRHKLTNLMHILVKRGKKNKIKKSNFLHKYGINNNKGLIEALVELRNNIGEDHLGKGVGKIMKENKLEDNSIRQTRIMNNDNVKILKNNDKLTVSFK
jgi:hypothetical protein